MRRGGTGSESLIGGGEIPAYECGVGGCFGFVCGGGGEDGFDEVDAGFDAVSCAHCSLDLVNVC